MNKLTIEKRAFNNDVKDMAIYILKLLGCPLKHSFIMYEINRQFFTWGAHSLYYIATDGKYGIQFQVNGLKFQGIIRVWYNIASDYFDLDFIQNQLVKSITDVMCDEIHHILHCEIEREDDERC